MINSIFLLVIGFLLIIFNVNAIYDKKDDFKRELENSLNKINENKEDGINLQEINSQLSEKISLLERQIELNNKDNIQYDVEPLKKEESVDSNNIKITEIKKLYEKGLSVEEIALELNIGKGEVLLVKELYLK